MVEEVPVVIVGGGPIGLTLSCILGKNNIQNVLLEKNDTTSDWPKSMITNTRSMELFHQLELDGALREEELPADNRIMITRSLMKIRPLLQFSPTQMIGRNPRKNTDDSYTFDELWTKEKILRLSQIYIEPILKKAASGYDSSEVKFGWEVDAISQSEDQVTVEAVYKMTGERKVYCAQYAIGCDGGRSFVRKSSGIEFKGEFDVARMKSISYKSPELMGKLDMLDEIFGALTVKTDLLAGTLPLNNEGLFVSHFFRGFDEQTKPGELLKKLFDNQDISCNIVFSNDWKGHFAFAETMQDGRVFLAGDSCHMMVPVGGFGMNTGVLDAFDLGWKLTATLKGWGGENLLASYTAERLPCIKKVLHRVRRLFFILENYVGILAFLISTRPFSYVMGRFFDGSDIDAGISGILFGLRLDASPLCIPSSTPLPPEDPLNYIPIAYPGCRAPYYEFEDGSSLCDKFGSAFTLLHLKPSNQNYEPLVSAAAHIGIPLKVLSFQDDELKALYREMNFVLIRPDFYIAWCGNEIPTLSHNNSINEGASVLMKVVTGATNLPVEWQRRESKSNGKTVWRFPLLVSLLVGAIAISVVLLRKYNII